MTFDWSPRRDPHPYLDCIVQHPDYAFICNNFVYNYCFVMCMYVFSIVMCYLSRTHSLVADETEGLHALILILTYSRDVIVIVARRGVKVRSHPKVVRYGLSLYITYFHICTTAVMDNRPNSVEILSHG